MYGDNKITTIRDLLDSKIGQFLGAFKNETKALWITPPIPPEYGEGTHCIICRNQRRVGLSSQHEWLIQLIFVPTSNVEVDETNYQKYDECLKQIRYWFPHSKEIHSTYSGFYPQTNFIFVYEKESYS